MSGDNNESKWDEEGSDFFIRIGIYIFISFILQAVSSLIMVKAYINFSEPTIEKLEPKRCRSDTSDYRMPHRRRSKFPKRRNIYDEMPAKSTLHKDPAVQSKSISVEQKRKEDNEDIKFIEKGTIFITSHNINEFAVMDGEMKPEKKVAIEKVSIDPKRCISYEIGENVDEFEEPIEKGGSGESGSAVTASIKQASIRY